MSRKGHKVPPETLKIVNSLHVVPVQSPQPAIISARRL